MRACGLLLALLMLVPISGEAQTTAAPLQLEAKIPLGAVRGRIDHLAIDLKRQRLFVAELGNDSVGVVDLAAGRVLQTIGGLSEPQGVGYEPTTDTVYVANAGDGSVRVLRGEDLAPVGRIELFYERDFGQLSARSALIGAIWQVKEDVALDLGLRGARVNDRTAGEIRAGITFAFAVP
jgi:YVTN family beta-propeller protein